MKNKDVFVITISISLFFLGLYLDSEFILYCGFLYILLFAISQTEKLDEETKAKNEFEKTSYSLREINHELELKTGRNKCY